MRLIPLAAPLVCALALAACDKAGEPETEGVPLDSPAPAASASPETGTGEGQVNSLNWSASGPAMEQDRFNASIPGFSTWIRFGALSVRITWLPNAIVDSGAGTDWNRGPGITVQRLGTPGMTMLSTKKLVLFRLSAKLSE